MQVTYIMNFIKRLRALTYNITIKQNCSYHIQCLQLISLKTRNVFSHVYLCICRVANQCFPCIKIEFLYCSTKLFHLEL